jgi:hypothetical protein
MENSIYDVENGFSRKVSNIALWMAVGLLVSAFVAAYIYFTGLWYDIAISFNGYGSMLLLVMQLGLVITLSSRLKTMTISSARILFLVYAGFTGVNLSVLPVIYDINSMFIAFGLSAVMFINLAIIANRTKKDMTKLGPYLMVGLVMLIFISVVGIFINLSAIEMIVNYLAVFLFMGLTLYDVQKIKKMYLHYAETNDENMMEKLTILGALELYLDFINMFLYILRIVGRRK